MAVDLAAQVRRSILAETPAGSRRRKPSEMQAALRRFALSGLAALIIVTVPVIMVARSLAADHALLHAAERTAQIVDHQFAQDVTEAALAGVPEALAELDSEVDPMIDDGHILRVTVRDLDGSIVYSDVDELIGQQIDLPAQLLARLQEDAPVSIVEDPPGDNIFGLGRAELVNVYVRAQAGDGNDYIFELTHPANEINRMQDEMLGILPVILVALAVLQLLQLGPALRMARRMRKASEIRRGLLQKSIAASEEERRRLARTLHDGVIQELAGLAYSLEAREQQQTASDSDFHALARDIVKGSIDDLRRITLTLYPPDLSAEGLPAALDGLGVLVRQRGAGWQLEIDFPEPAALARPDLLYRAAREAVTNASKHASARLVKVSLRQSNDAVVLEVVDDGVGFTPDAARRAEHIGLRIMRDTVREADGTLRVESAPGAGTRIVMAFPAGQ